MKTEVKVYVLIGNRKCNQCFETHTFNLRMGNWAICWDCWKKRQIAEIAEEVDK